MSLGSALFGLALLVTATVVVPIAMATLVHRESPVVPWVRRHLRRIWALIALLWLASLYLKLRHGSEFAQLDVIASALGFVCAVGVAFLQPRHGAVGPG